MKNLFILQAPFGGFKEGTIIQKGSDVTDEGIEYFDVTTEMETDECYSVYNIPLELLSPADEETVNKVNDYFDTYLKNY